MWTKINLILSITAQVDRKTHNLLQFQNQEVKPSNKLSRNHDQSMQSHSRLMCGTCQTFVLWVLRVVQGSTAISYLGYNSEQSKYMWGSPCCSPVNSTSSLKQVRKVSKRKMESRKGTLRKWEQCRNNAYAQFRASQH